MRGVSGGSDGLLLSVNWGMIALFQAFMIAVSVEALKRGLQHCCVCVCVSVFALCDSFVLSGDSVSVSNEGEWSFLLHVRVRVHGCLMILQMRRLKGSVRFDIIALIQEGTHRLTGAHQSNFAKAGFAVLKDCVAVKTRCWQGTEIPPALPRLSTSCFASFHLSARHISFFSLCVLAIVPNFYPALCMAALVCMAV